jgi:hypothetical protein
MAFSRIQSATGANTTFASSVTSSGITTTRGNLLIALIEADTVAANGINVTDNKGNYWTRVISEVRASTFDLELWYTVVRYAGSGHTVTATDNGGGVDSIIIVEEWSGSATADVVDRSEGDNLGGGGSTALNSGNTSTTRHENQLIIAGGVVAIAGVSLSEGAGYSNPTTASTAFSILRMASKVATTNAVEAGTFTAGVASSWACVVGTFKVLPSQITNYAPFIKVGDGIGRNERAT